MSNFQKVKFYLQELGYDITTEDQADEVFVINAPEDGIQNLVIDCEPPILIIEQFLFVLNKHNEDIFKQLLQKNREIVHGAFALDDSGTKVVFRDTLQLENLDLNELEGSLNSLKLLVAEYSATLLEFAR
ncbi:MAG: YbjN domain-containing protein [Thermoflexibacter sp.]|nr:YbjN domain-containing protein [Thermoflexibacter sp.]